jgi:hypothetical protein
MDEYLFGTRSMVRSLILAGLLSVVPAIRTESGSAREVRFEIVISFRPAYQKHVGYICRECRQGCTYLELDTFNMSERVVVQEVVML